MGVRGGRAQRLIGLPARLVAIAVLGAACTSTPDPSDPPPDAFAVPPFRQSFGPVFAPNPPAGALHRIEGAVLARDHRTLFVSFTGGKGFRPNDPCAEEYQAWAGLVGDGLEVQVSTVAHPEQPKLGPNQGCSDVGFGYFFRILLPAPFVGDAIRDREAGPLWLPRPEAVAEPQALPTGWQLANVTTIPDHELWREYRPGPAAAPWAGAPGADDRTAALFQVVGGQPDHQIDAPIGVVEIRGQRVPVGRNGDDGFMVNWRLGADGMTLTVIDPAVTLDAFVAMANTVAVPAP